MNTNKSVFFPCAGFGTRMGDLGKALAKPLWPLFETTLLEAQIRYTKELGFSTFYINTHHNAESFKRKKIERETIISHEEDILGSGGCFIKLKKENPNLKELYIFNPDSFLVLSKSDWERFFLEAKTVDNLLIGIPCKESDSYNRLEVDNGLLKRIVPPAKEAPEITYSGFGKVNLNSGYLSKSREIENIGFFQSICDPELKNTRVFIPNSPFEFWDFGELDFYTENMFNLLNTESNLRSFLIDHDLLRPDYLGTNSYRSKTRNIINFTSSENLKGEKRGIYLELNGEILKAGS